MEKVVVIGAGGVSMVAVKKMALDSDAFSDILPS
jgi:saccharopine dehydrogenase-like NADP-dependent oxidoreductase